MVVLFSHSAGNNHPLSGKKAFLAFPTTPYRPLLPKQRALHVLKLLWLYFKGPVGGLQRKRVNYVQSPKEWNFKRRGRPTCPWLQVFLAAGGITMAHNAGEKLTACSTTRSEGFDQGGGDSSKGLGSTSLGGTSGGAGGDGGTNDQGGGTQKSDQTRLRFLSHNSGTIRKQVDG